MLEETTYHPFAINSLKFIAMWSKCQGGDTVIQDKKEKEKQEDLLHAGLVGASYIRKVYKWYIWDKIKKG